MVNLGCIRAIKNYSYLPIFKNLNMICQMEFYIIHKKDGILIIRMLQFITYLF